MDGEDFDAPQLHARVEGGRFVATCTATRVTVADPQGIVADVGRHFPGLAATVVHWEMATADTIAWGWKPVSMP
jgi:hypothetical protein